MSDPTDDIPDFLKDMMEQKKKPDNGLTRFDEMRERMRKINQLIQNGDNKDNN